MGDPKNKHKDNIKPMSMAGLGRALKPFRLDERRRNFLKFAIFGGLGFVAGRYLQPLVNTLKGGTVLSERTFDNFQLTETGKQLRITDDDGEELLIIDKDAL